MAFGPGNELQSITDDRLDASGDYPTRLHAAYVLAGYVQVLSAKSKSTELQKSAWEMDVVHSVQLV